MGGAPILLYKHANFNFRIFEKLNYLRCSKKKKLNLRKR